MRPDWKRIAIGCGAAMFVCMGLGRFSYTAMVPLLIWNGQLTPVSSGYIGGFNLVAYLAGAFISNFLVKDRGQKVVLTSSLWIGVLALFASAIPVNGLWLGFWRSAIGLATGIIMVQSLALTVNSAPRNQRATAASYVFIGVGSGILFSSLIVPFLSGSTTIWAWLGIAVIGFAVANLAQWGWKNVVSDTVDLRKIRRISRAEIMSKGLPVLIFANFCFSFGIVPHTLFWVDFISRYLDFGQEIGSLQWFLVGIFSIFGPVAAACLAKGIGTARALSLILVLLGIGIGLPSIATTLPILTISTLLFGSQPGLSVLLATRVRDLGEPVLLPELMRVMILANGAGAAVGGLALPKLLEITGSYEIVFFTGAMAFLLAAVASVSHGVKKFVNPK